MLFAVDLPRQRIYYFNSQRPAEGWKADRDAFERCWYYFLKSQSISGSRQEWSKVFKPRLPNQVQQTDDKSSALLVMLYMKVWAGHIPEMIICKMKFPSMLQCLRRRFMVDILLNDDNACRDYVLNQSVLFGGRKGKNAIDTGTNNVKQVRLCKDSIINKGSNKIVTVKRGKK